MAREKHVCPVGLVPLTAGSAATASRACHMAHVECEGGVPRGTACTRNAGAWGPMVGSVQEERLMPHAFVSSGSLCGVAWSPMGGEVGPHPASYGILACRLAEGAHR